MFQRRGLHQTTRLNRVENSSAPWTIVNLFIVEEIGLLYSVSMVGCLSSCYTSPYSQMRLFKLVRRETSMTPQVSCEPSSISPTFVAVNRRSVKTMASTDGRACGGKHCAEENGPSNKIEISVGLWTRMYVYTQWSALQYCSSRMKRRVQE